MSKVEENGQGVLEVDTSDAGYETNASYVIG